MRNTRGKLLAAGIVVALVAVAAQVNPTPANAPAPGCDRDCYVREAQAQREAEGRARVLSQMQQVCTRRSAPWGTADCYSR